ncbi:MAG: hypothetical protein ACLSGN_05400 [Oscillospiraceae bacterium]
MKRKSGLLLSVLLTIVLSFSVMQCFVCFAENSDTEFIVGFDAEFPLRLQRRQRNMLDLTLIWHRKSVTETAGR